MRSLFIDLLSFATIPALALTAVAGIVIAALGSYLRKQSYKAVTWTLAPWAARLPWNSASWHSKVQAPELVARLSIVDVFLLSTDGREARYRKTSTYAVTRGGFHSYKEGVASAGTATSFTTKHGIVVSTTKEHGFYISEIDMGDVLDKGESFTNVYTADLHECFVSQHEHWTQEIAIATDHLVLHIHFPMERPPLHVKCKIIDGLDERQINTAAKVLGSGDHKSIVWTVVNPKLKDIYKLEWVW